MIPSSSFLLDGDTALVVCPNDPDWLRLAFWHGSDRPCDTCGGDGVIADGPERPFYFCGRPLTTCPDCDGTGRDTFKIEVQAFTVFDAEDGERAIRYEPLTHRVHVIDVLPIVAQFDDRPAEGRYVQRRHRRWWVVDRSTGDRIPVNLPPDAAPGKWAVRLAVHQ